MTSDEPFTCDRVNQIVDIDLNGLLSTIRDLQLNMSEHQRNDQMPIWAESLLQRIEQLENPLPGASKSHDKSPLSENFHQKSDKKGSILLAPKDDKQPTTLTQIYIDYKIDSVQSEVDRLRQLLAFRPTTSEFQLVVLSLNDVHRKMYDSLDDIAAGIRGTVEEKVATEMDCFTSQLRKSEKSNTKRIQLSLDKTERLNKSILELSEASSSAMGDIEKKFISFQKNYNSLLLQSNNEVLNIKEEAERIKEEAERAESQWESSISGLQGVIESNRKVSQRALDDLFDRCADDRFLLISNSVSDVKDALGTLAEEIEIDSDIIKNLTARKGSLSHHIGTIGERLNAFEAFIASYSNENMIESHRESQRKIERQESNIEENRSSIGTLKETFKSMMVKLNKQHKISVESIALLEKNISTRIEDDKISLNSRVDALFLEKDKENDEIRKNTDITLGLINGKLTDLFDITTRNKESINSIESNGKTSQLNIEKLDKTTIDQDDRLNIYSSDVVKLESEFRLIVDDMTKKCFNFITERHQELVRECIFL